MASSISTVEAREKLKPRREPYYAKIREGCYLGYRKMTAGSAGTWTARCRSGTSGSQLKTSLGSFEARPKSQRYDAALEAAERWFSTVGLGGSNEIKTVKDACEAYLQFIEETHGGAGEGQRKAAELRARYGRYVYEHRISNTQLSKLTMGMVEQWRRQLAAKPVVINPHADPTEQRNRPRSAATLNRDMTALRAALNHAHTRGNVATDIAWLGALRPVAGADKARDIYLQKSERKQLLEQVRQDLRPMLEALCLLPLRPGAVAGLRVGNLDPRHGVLTVGKDKVGRDRKIKLPEATADFFRRHCQNKLPAAPIFSRADGKPWDKDAWKKPFKEAAALAGLSEKASAYSLRHSTITDLVPHLDLLTVAQISGTSVQMIQKHYGHLQQDRAAHALAGLTL